MPTANGQKKRAAASYLYSRCNSSKQTNKLFSNKKIKCFSAEFFLKKDIWVNKKKQGEETDLEMQQFLFFGGKTWSGFSPVWDLSGGDF